MGYTEREILRMTLRKFICLWEDYQKFNGTYKEQETINDLIPEYM